MSPAHWCGRDHHNHRRNCHYNDDQREYHHNDDRLDFPIDYDDFY